MPRCRRRRAHLRLHARLDSDAARTVRLRTSADGVVVGETEHPLRRRRQRDRVVAGRRPTAAVVAHALGDQPLTDIDVELLVDGESQ